MKTHGLLFTGPMIRAFLRPVNPKTQTRRKITAANSLVDGAGMSAKRWAEMNFDFSRAVVDQGPSPAGNPGPYLKVPARNVRLNGNEETVHRIYPRIDVGDVIYAKETWQIFTNDEIPKGRDRLKTDITIGSPAHNEPGYVAYRADGEMRHAEWGDANWKSALHMPEKYARIRRTVTAVRPESIEHFQKAMALRGAFSPERTA